MITDFVDRRRLLFSNFVLIAGIAMLAFTLVATLGTQCAQAASGSCSVGDSETLTSNIIINEDGDDADSRIEGDTDANLVYVDAGNDRVGIGTSTPATLFEVDGAATFATVGVGAVSDPLSQFNLNPTFSATTPVVFLLEGAITSTDDGGAPKFAQFGASGASITTAFSGADTVARISTLELFEPNITLGATGGQDVVTSAQTLYVGDAPTEATAGGNHAISMPSGAFNVSDGQGTSGEQLTSGGQDANVTWTSAASIRSSKRNITPNSGSTDALQKMIDAQVYNFKYKPTTWKTVTQTDRKGNVYEVRIPVDRVPSTGDFDTTYVGIMADEVPWAMHYNGTVLNPINTFGYTVLAIQELNALIEDLDARIAVLEGR